MASEAEEAKRSEAGLGEFPQASIDRALEHPCRIENIHTQKCIHAYIYVYMRTVMSTCVYMYIHMSIEREGIVNKESLQTLAPAALQLNR